MWPSQNNWPTSLCRTFFIALPVQESSNVGVSWTSRLLCQNEKWIFRYTYDTHTVYNHHLPNYITIIYISYLIVYFCGTLALALLGSLQRVSIKTQEHHGTPIKQYPLRLGLSIAAFALIQEVSSQSLQLLAQVRTSHQPIILHPARPCHITSNVFVTDPVT